MGAFDGTNNGDGVKVGRAPRHGPCCNNSVALFECVPGSAPGTPHRFEFVATVMEYATSPGEEGASEHATIALSESGALLAVVRIDGGDGEPHGRHLLYRATRSTDFGNAWSPPWSITGAGSARPRLLRLGNGALVLSGGRPGLGV